MKHFLLVCFFTSSISVLAQDSLITNQLQGTWKLTGIRTKNSPYLNLDAPYESEYRWLEPNLHWVISNDRIYEIDYPCCLKNSFQYRTFKDGIYLLPDSTKHFQEPGYRITLSDDSLIAVDFYEYESTYYFIKDTLPSKTAGDITNAWINPKCLYGDWEIPVGEVSVEYDAINVWYPFTLPETIHIDATNIHRFFASNRFYLEVDGVKRPFKVGNVSLHHENLILYPEKWVEDYRIKHDLQPYQLEQIWLRRLEQ